MKLVIALEEASDVVVMVIPRHLSYIPHCPLEQDREH